MHLFPEQSGYRTRDLIFFSVFRVKQYQSQVLEINCAWTSILACSSRLHEQSFHLCCRKAGSLHPNPPWGRGLGKGCSVLLRFPGSLPSLIRFHIAPKVSTRIWVCLLLISFLHSFTHPPTGLIPAILSVPMRYLADSSKHSEFTGNKQEGQARWAQDSVLTKERPFFQREAHSWVQTHCFCSLLQFPHRQVGQITPASLTTGGSANTITLWRTENSFKELDKCQLFA